MNKEDSESHPAESRLVEEQYTAFTPRERWCITALVAYGSLFSTLSSFIYYPAFPSISKSLSVSVNQINWTVTSYMAVASIGPTLVGDLADVLGRRPAYIGVMSLYTATNIAIAATVTYSTLVGLRVVQGLIISGTFCITYGVIADIASPAERGSFISLVAFATTIAPTFGPVLGGALAFAGGWTWIFWFLSIASWVCLLLITFLLPETARNIVGNGSTAPSRLSRLPFNLSIFQHWKNSDEGDSNVLRQRGKWRVPNPLQSLIILVRKDNLAIIVACGFMYVVYTVVNTSLSVLFVEIYDLTQWQAGLIYLPFGIGGIVSSLISGRSMNVAYRRARTKRGLSTDRATGDALDNFPVERARLSLIWLPLLVTSSSVLAFGWVLDYAKHMAIPLCLQFIIGLCMQFEFSIYNTLLTDKNAHNPSAAQASSNIVRCGLTAVVVAFQQDVFKILGVGWTYTIMSALCIVSLALFAVDYRWGSVWRQQALSKNALHRAITNSAESVQAREKV